ncbi:hypothetical protein FZC79_10225 [Rossellomorea vietnamensis]|uniref:Uncharacterized protein n=1 Tax=Rossellomorea vietnamensis TaxID=218284 RepID=A0A5D4KE01_9BACI|nr:hypothetical protein [Rossellomorea vietnamensis]TYR75538.1 hypothetical protein FZC79_10225 [Rossellomorea vietnamensis]
MKEESEKEKMLLVELEAFQKSYSPDTIDISEIIKDMTNLWPNLSVEDKRQFVQLSVKELWVDKISTKRSPESLKIMDIKFQ